MVNILPPPPPSFQPRIQNEIVIIIAQACVPSYGLNLLSKYALERTISRLYTLILSLGREPSNPLRGSRF